MKLLLHIDPKIPNEWPGFTVTYRYGNTSYFIEVKNHTGTPSLMVDGKEVTYSPEPLQDGLYFELRDDGQEHHVEVNL